MKRNRKLALYVAAFAGAALAMTGAGSALATKQAQASPPVSESQALSRVKALSQVPKVFQLSSESYNTATGGDATYDFSFTYTSPDNSSEWINVTVDAVTGAITSYSRSSNATGFVYPLPVNAAKAKTLALKWAQRLYPAYVEQTQMQPLAPVQGPLNQAITYQYDFARVVNGILAPFDGLSITIDQNGTLIAASEHWTTAAFPSAAQALRLAQASLIYKRDLNLYLAYWTNWNASGKTVPYLTYQQPQGSYPQWWNNQFADPNLRISGIPVIDARTGQAIGATGKVQVIPVHTTVQPLVPGGEAQAPGAKPVHWSEQQALADAKRVLEIPADAKLQGANQYQSEPGGDVNWNLTWTTPGGKQVSATVDATVGVLTDYNHWDIHPLATASGVSSHLTQAELTATAASFVKKILPNDAGGVALIPATDGTSGKPPQGNYTIEPLINGIPDVSDTGNVSVDVKTGEVASYYSNFPFGAVRYPAVNKAVPLAQAKQNWTAGQPLRLMYLLTQPAFDKQTGTTPTGKVMLAYTPTGNILNNGNVMDATTGEFVPASGQTPAYTGSINDIGGIPQASEIRLMVEHGLLAVDRHGDVHPQKDMTREAFVKLVVDALGRVQPLPATHQLGAYAAAMKNTSSAASGYSEVYTAFVNGWLQNGKVFEPNQPITRSDAAQLLVRALGYGELMGYPSAFRIKAGDAASIPSAQYAGDAIALALGLLPLQSGAFHPDGHVTVADAAQAVVRMVSDNSQSLGIFNGAATGAASSGSPTAAPGN